MDNFGRINLKRCSITQEFVTVEEISIHWYFAHNKGYQQKESPNFTKYFIFRSLEVLISSDDTHKTTEIAKIWYKELNVKNTYSDL